MTYLARCNSALVAPRCTESSPLGGVTNSHKEKDIRPQYTSNDVETCNPLRLYICLTARILSKEQCIADTIANRPQNNVYPHIPTHGLGSDCAFTCNIPQRKSKLNS